MNTQRLSRSHRRSTLSCCALLALAASFNTACGSDHRSGAQPSTTTPVPTTTPTTSKPTPGSSGAGGEAEASGGADAGGTGSGGSPETPVSTDSAVVVKVRPQSTAETNGTPVAGLSLPKPSRLPKTQGAADGPLLDGASFGPELPHENVSSKDHHATFSASAAAAGSLAYATYDLSAADFDANGPQTIAITWQDDAPEGDAYWIALARADGSAWDFFAGPDDGVLTVDSLSRYIDGNQAVRAVVVVAEASEYTLVSLSLGAPELRGTGLVADEEEPAAEEPPLTGGGPLPRSVNLRPSMPNVRSQGHVGSCSGFATAGAFNYELNRVYAAYGWDDTKEINIVSPKWLYNSTPFKPSDPCPDGGHPLGAVAEFLLLHGGATELYAPYGSSKKSSYECSTKFLGEAYADAAVLAPKAVHYFNPGGNAGVEAAKRALYNGHGITFGTRLDSAFHDYESGVWNFSGTGQEQSGHAMILAGYDDDKAAFYVKNSWGYDWGDNGYVWIGYQSFVSGTMLMGGAYYFDVEFSLPAAQRLIATMPQIQPPAHVLASDGLYPDKVVVSWDADRSANGYKIYRDDGKSPVASIDSGSVTSWEDKSLSDRSEHRYWVTATAQSAGGPVETAPSATDSGYEATDPLTKGVTPTSGASGSVLTLNADVVGSGPFTYRWDFGGGAMPATSPEENPAVILGNQGTYKASVTITGAHGSSTYNFDLVVDFPASVYRHTWGGSARDAGNGVAVDVFGLTHLAGVTRSFGAGGSDVLIAMYDAGGQLRYSTSFGTAGDEQANGLATDKSGRANFAGSIFSSNNTDVLYGSVLSTGQVLFANALGEGGDDIGNAIAVDATDNKYLVGQTAGGAGKGDMYVVKLDANDNIAWQRTWGTATNRESALAVTTSADGSRIYIAGVAATTDRRDDLVTLAMTKDGNVLWARRWGSTRDEADAHVAVGNDGRVYVSCTTHADKFASQDVAVIGYDADGQLRFQRAASGDKYDSPTNANHGLAVDAANHVYLLSDYVDGNQSGRYKHLLYKLDGDGNLSWVRETAGNENQTKLLAMGMSPLGKLAFTGSAIGPTNYAWGDTKDYLFGNPTETVASDIDGQSAAIAFVPRPVQGTSSSPEGITDDGRAGSEDMLSYTYNPNQ